MMASHIDESQDQVLAACIAIVYVLDTASNNWKALGEQGGFSNVQLIQTRQNALYRIRGRLVNNGQIVINVLLEKDIKYEVLDEDKSNHIISSHSNVFLLKLRQESDGDQFATVVRNILRLLQETSSPREAWMPASAATQPAAQAQPIKEHLLNSSNLDQYCDKLSNAIQEGSVEVATEVAKIMAEQNVSLSIKQKNPKIITVNPGEDSFNLRVVVEDRETSGGVFQMKVSTNTTVAELQEEVAERYGFPPKVQKWISGMKMAKPHEKLFDLNLRGKGATAYLYIVDGRSVGLRRPEFDKYIKKQEERKNAQLSMSLELNAADPQMPLTTISGTQLPRTASLPSLPREGQSIGSSASGNLPAAVPLTRETQVMNPAQFSGITAPQEINTRQTVGTPGSEAKIFSSSSISDLQHMLESFGPLPLPNVLRLHLDQRPNNTVVETEVIPQGWVCKKCTFVNKPTRPGCEICGEGRPEDYVVPANPQISEQERLRIEKERQETEIFQRTLDRQQQEQDEAREVNFRQLMQAAQQSLIGNTEEFDCPICFMPVEPGDGVVLRECLHCFCRDCLKEHIRNCTDPEVQCPFQDENFACHFVITTQEVKALLPPEDFNKFLNRSLATAESQAANSFHCKTPNCPGWCIYEDNINTFQCPVCRKPNCLTCKAIHPEMNCKEYQEDLKRRAENDVAAKQTQQFLEQMITKGDAMKCPQCAIILLKKDGCDWMRCSMCRLEICWATRGPRWGPQGVGDLSGGCKCRVNGKKCHPKCRNCH